MKRLALIAAILIASAWPSGAQDHAAEQQVLDAGRKPRDLFQSSGSPFDLEIDFTAQSREPTSGHLSVKWQSKNHWWSKVAVGGFEQTNHPRLDQIVDLHMGRHATQKPNGDLSHEACVP